MAADASAAGATDDADDDSDETDPDNQDEPEPSGSSLSIDVEQLLSDVCGGCHNDTSRTAELDLASQRVAERVSGVGSASCEGLILANPQDPTGSLLYRKVSGEDTGCGEPMPPAPIPSLTDDEALALRDWIAGLAPPSATITCSPRDERACEGIGNEAWWPDLTRTGDALDLEMSKTCVRPTQVCSADGAEWSTCAGKFPSVEDCTTPQDEDCNLDTPANRCEESSWAIGLTGTRTQLFNSVDADGEGNVYLFGTFEGELDFGGGVVSSDVPDGQFKNDVVMAKYDRFGTHVWSKTFGDTSNQYATQITVDEATGDLAFVMRLFGAVQFASSAPEHRQSGGGDFVVGLLDDDGGYQWSQLFGGGGPDRGERIALSRDDGDVLVAGKVSASEDEPPTVPSRGAVMPAGQADALVVRLGRDVGDVKWSALLGGAEYTEGEEGPEGAGEDCDAGDGDVYRRCGGCGAQHCVPDATSSAAGSWADTCEVLHVDDGTPRFPCERSDLTCSEEEGSVGMCRSGDDDYAFGIDSDADGDVYVAGRFEGYFDFAALDGTEGSTQVASRGAHDIFVVKLDGETGNVEWSKHFGGSGDDRAYDVAWQPGTGNLIVTGFFTGSVDFGGVELETKGGSDDDDLLLASLDTVDGSPVWVKGYGDAESQFGVSHELGKTTRTTNLAIDEADHIFLGGSLYGSFDGEIAARAAPDPRPDAFFVKLSPDGGYLNGRVHGGGGSELAYDMALDPAGNGVLLVGRFYGSSFDLGSAGTLLGVANNSSMFAAKWPRP